ncbi:MAG: hemerythrin domain-containing protein [Kofleriaceae bacterium]
MSKLIQQLRTEHQVLVARLDEVRNSIDPKTGKLPLEKAVFALTMVKKSLLAHLGKEDEELYPLLRHAASKDPAVHDLLKRFGDEMQQISAAALSFFEKYDNRGLFSQAFPSDLEGLYKVLAARIQAEESELYPAYERAYVMYGDFVPPPAPVEDTSKSPAARSASVLAWVWVAAAAATMIAFVKFVA